MKTRYAIAIVTMDEHDQTHVFLQTWSVDSTICSYDTEQQALNDNPVGRSTVAGDIISRTVIPYQYKD